MPPQEGVGCDEGLEVVQRPAIQGVCIRRQAATLRIGEPHPPLGQLLAKDAVFFVEIVDDVALLLVDPPGDGDDKETARPVEAGHIPGERTRGGLPP